MRTEREGGDGQVSLGRASSTRQPHARRQRTMGRGRTSCEEAFFTEDGDCVREEEEHPEKISATRADEARAATEGRAREAHEVSSVVTLYQLGPSDLLRYERRDVPDTDSHGAELVVCE